MLAYKNVTLICFRRHSRIFDWQKQPRSKKTCARRTSNYDFEANTWNARASSISLVRQFDSQSAVQASSPISEAITASNNIKFEIKNDKLDQLQEYVSKKLLLSVFSYKNSLFMQTFGTPMGSCIAPLIADIKSSLFYRNIQNAQKETAKDNSVT